MKRPIHPLATQSVVLPFVVILPVVAGLAAVIAALIAIKGLASLADTRRGHTRAVTGIILGVVHIAAVGVVTYNYSLVLVQPGHIALVVRGGEIDRICPPGAHVVCLSYPRCTQAVR